MIVSESVNQYSVPEDKNVCIWHCLMRLDTTDKPGNSLG